MSSNQRARYRTVFNEEYNEYMRLHDSLERKISIFHELKSKLREAQRLEMEGVTDIDSLEVRT